jgi:hypothetical protein
MLGSGRREDRAFKELCAGGRVVSHGRQQIDVFHVEPVHAGFLRSLIPMANIQVDHSQMAPSILPADVPELSDDECLACLARAVDAPDSARLDEVAALIGRLAVTIE